MIYLDNAATAPVFPEVLETMLPWFQPERVGNPGSIHTQGVKARNAVEKARKQVAQMIGAEPSEIFFTSGGTESNNTWLRCTKDLVVRRPIILTTKIEHHSVIEPIEHGIVSPACRHAEYVKVYRDGSVNLEDLERLLQLYEGEVGGVSIMWVNNELGTVNPIKEIGTLCKKYKVPFHGQRQQFQPRHQRVVEAHRPVQAVCRPRSAGS